jgi:cardiolipin synthase
MLVWSSPPPFDHSKLMIVDRAWTFLGSANLDPRSLRLNFELNLECYGLELAARLDRWFRDRLRDAVLVTRTPSRAGACRSSSATGPRGCSRLTS